MSSLRLLWLKIKSPWLIARNYQRHLAETRHQIDETRQRLTAIESQLRELLIAHVDVGVKQKFSQVVVIGQLHGVDYVRIFDIPHESTRDLVDQLRVLEQRINIGRIDAPRGVPPDWIRGSWK